MRIRVWTGFLALWLTGLATADIDLRGQMSSEAFEAAGLNKLSERELTRLEQWLQHGAENAGDAAASNQTPAAPADSPLPGSQPAPVTASAETSFGDEQLAPVPEPPGSRIRARVKGEFRGWKGNTLFRLDNGQIWRQRIGGRYGYKAANPEVEIRKGRFGYYLRLIDTGRQVGVKRIK